MSKVSLWVALLTLAAATAAGAAEPGQLGIQMGGFAALGQSNQQGWFGRVEPGLGFTWQVTPRLALRPEVALGVGRHSGNFLQTGVLATYDLRLGRWRPYVAGGLAYTHRAVARGASTGLNLPPAPGSIGRNTVSLQAGLGVERVLNRRFSLFAEVGAGYTPGERYQWDLRGWSRRSGWDADAPFRSSFGVTLNLR